MGWGDVYVGQDLLDAAACKEVLEKPRDQTIEAYLRCVQERTSETSVAQLSCAIERSSQAILLVDVGSSNDFCRAHVPGASWCARSALPEVLKRLESAAAGGDSDSPTQQIVLVSRDSVLAYLAASDLNRADITVLEGGTDAWREAGHEIEEGEQRMLCQRDDHWLASSERAGRPHGECTAIPELGDNSL